MDHREENAAIAQAQPILEQYFHARNVVTRSIDTSVVAALADEVLFASFIGREGNGVALAVVYHPQGARGLARIVGAPEAEAEVPAFAWSVTRLRAHPFAAASLAKVARGLRYGTQLVVVGGSANDLRIDGIAQRNHRTDGGDVLRIAAPRAGSLVFEHGHFEALRYEAGKRWLPALNVLGIDGPVRSAIGRMTGDLGRGDHFYSFTELALSRVLREMRATGAGAIVALSARKPHASLLERVPYRWIDTQRLGRCIADDKKKRLAMILDRELKRAPRELDRVLRGPEANRVEAENAGAALTAAIEDVARMSAIDGAVLMGPNLEVYGAGCFIHGSTPERVVRALDVRAQTTERLPSHYGDRHNAAFTFVLQNENAAAFVVSRDGPVTCAMRNGNEVVVWSVRVSET